MGDIGTISEPTRTNVPLPARNPFSVPKPHTVPATPAPAPVHVPEQVPVSPSRS